MVCPCLPLSLFSFTSSSLSTHTIEVRLFSLRGIFSLKTSMQSKLHHHVIFYYLHLIILTQNFSFPYRINAKHFFWVIYSSLSGTLQNNSISWPTKSRNVTLCGKGVFANIVKLKILRWDRSEWRWALKSMTSPYRRRDEDMDTDTQGRRR